MGVNIITAADGLAKEGSSFGIIISFLKEDLVTALTPITLTWSLVDKDNLIVNDREDIVVATPAASVTIELEGNDLIAVENDEGTHTHLWLVIKGTYTGDTGATKPFTDQVRFSVEPIKGEI